MHGNRYPYKCALGIWGWAMKKQGFITLFVLLFTLNQTISNAEPVKTQQTVTNNVLSKPKMDVGEELRDYIKDIKLQLISAQAEIDKLQDSGFNYKKTLADKDNKINVLEKQLQLLMQGMVEKDKQLILHNSTLYSKEQELTLKSAELEKKINELNERNKQSEMLVSKESAINDMKNQLENYKIRLNDAASKVAILEGQLIQSKNEVADLKNKNTTLASSSTPENDTLISSMKAQIDNYKLRISEITSKLSMSQGELSQTRKELADLKNQNSVLASNNLKCGNEITSKPLENIKSTVAAKKQDQDIFVKVIQYMQDEKPTAALVYYNIGRVYQDNKDYTKAISNYKQALTIDTEFNKAYMQLGLVYAEIGDYDKAIETFKQYLRYTNNIKEQEIIRQFLSKLEKMA